MLRFEAEIAQSEIRLIRFAIRSRIRFIQGMGGGGGWN